MNSTETMKAICPDGTEFFDRDAISDGERSLDDLNSRDFNKAPSGSFSGKDNSSGSR